MSQPLYALLMAAGWAKTDQLIKFAKAIIERGYVLIGSGGTAKFLNAANVPTEDLATYVGGGEMLGHRVVSISRQLAAQLISNLKSEADTAEMASLNLPPIDLAYVNFYALEDEIAKADCTRESVIDATDIGGPLAIRAAAKGRRVVIVDPSDIDGVLEWLDQGRPGEQVFLDYLAAKAEFIVTN